MKTFKSLQEERGEKAYKQAISMGLKYGGFGYWKDPQTNETVYKTENDTLVRVEPRDESELAAKGGPDAGGGRPDPMAGGGMPGQGMMGAGGMLQMPGAGGAMPGAGILGAPEAGAEQVDKDRSWEPGPDGDTCVGPDSEDSGKVPEDSFVGRTNFLKWRAGPDGDNMNTISLGVVKEQIRELSINEAEFNPDRKQHWKNVAKAKRFGPRAGDGTETKIDAGLGLGTNKIHSIMKRAGVTDPRAEDPKYAGNNNPIPGSSKGRGLAKNAQWTGKSQGEPLIKDTTVPKTSSWGMEYDYDDESPQKPSWIGAGTSKVQDKDKQQVKGMNDAIAGYMKDSKFDLDQYDTRTPVASGAFGSFTLGDDGIGIKEGNIGPGELAALYAMRDNPAFPTLINARFDGPFKHQSAGFNNPGDNSDSAFRRNSDELQCK